MRWTEVIDLGNATETIAHGESIATLTYRTVFANRRSVREAEFYQAGNIGMKPEVVFEVRTIDFLADEKVRHDGKVYAIVRVEEIGDRTFLTCVNYVGSGA